MLLGTYQAQVVNQPKPNHSDETLTKSFTEQVIIFIFLSRVVRTLMQEGKRYDGINVEDHTPQCSHPEQGDSCRVTRERECTSHIPREKVDIPFFVTERSTR